MRIKISVILAMAIITSFQASAQFKKGTRMVGASIANIFFSGGNSDYTYDNGLAGTFGVNSRVNSYGLSITPNMGWFVSDHTVIGAQVQLNYNNYKRTDDQNGSTYFKNEEKKFSLGVGGFVRNYFASTGTFLPFAQAGLGIGVGSSKTDGFYYDTGYKETSTGKSSGELTGNFNAAFGMTKLLSPNVGLDFSIGYNFTYFKSDFSGTTLRDDGIDGSIDSRAEENYSQKFNGHGAAISIGLQFFLNRK